MRLPKTSQNFRLRTNSPSRTRRPSDGPAGACGISRDAASPGQGPASLDIGPSIATIAAMDGPHPQRIELEQRIAWFLANPKHELCVVVEPESQSIVRFHIPLKTLRGYRDEKYGRIMEVELTPDEVERGEPVLTKLGFEHVGDRKGTFDGLRNQVFPRFEKPTTHARNAAGDVLRIMDEVFGVGDAWLWTFHVDDPDQWPDPLPKPDPWPPTAA